MISLIYAQSINGYIGKDGDLLFVIPDDLRRFKELTKGSVVIMGRKTWESLPEKSRPLPNRTNVVLSRQVGLHLPGATVFSSLADALIHYCEEDVFIIGGESLYLEGIDHADVVYQTTVYRIADGDARAPYVNPGVWQVIESSEVQHHNDLTYQYNTYRKLP